MRICQEHWTPTEGWLCQSDEALADAHLVLYFAAPSALTAAAPYDYLRSRYPQAHVVGCSTGGEIHGVEVEDGTVVATVMKFASTPIRCAAMEIAGPNHSWEAGAMLARQLPIDGLKAVFVLADGTRTNGSALIAGIKDILGEDIILTGGLAGDGPHFGQTHVGCDQPARVGQVVAVGFYGDAVRIGWGSYGGWERFGPERLITRAEDNILYELNGEPALELYKRYLGDEADNLPSSALFFPLTIRPSEDEAAVVVRTIVGVDEQNQSLIFAGDIPQDWMGQLMRGYFDGLIDGACRAGETSAAFGQPSLAILVSCIGRKLLLGQRTVEEVEAVVESLGPNCAITGFYSYGEIAPHGVTGKCELHNQTMTITTIGEA